MTAAQELNDLGYTFGRELPNGDRIGLAPFILTTGLVVGIEDNGNYRLRFCYERLADAIKAILAWDGAGDPPGPWIKAKGEGGDRCNPTACQGCIREYGE